MSLLRTTTLLIIIITNLTFVNSSPIASDSHSLTGRKKSVAKAFDSRAAFDNEFPFVVLLQIRTRGTKAHPDNRCGGSILTAVRVITSCNCLVSYTKKPVIEIYAGTTTVGYTSLGQVIGDQIKTTTLFTLHPKCVYASHVAFYNIGIVQISAKDPLIFAYNVQPLKLPGVSQDRLRDYRDRMANSRTLCVALGWVFEDIPAPDIATTLTPKPAPVTSPKYIHDELKILAHGNVLRVVHKYILTNQRCEALLLSYFKEFLGQKYPSAGNEKKRITNNGNFCTEEMRPKDYQNMGYPGAPVVCQNMVMGVLSRGYSLSKDKRYHLDTFTSVEFGIQWLPDTGEQEYVEGIPPPKTSKNNKTIADCYAPGLARKNSTSKSKIYNGRKALEHEFPFVVFLLLTMRSATTFSVGDCGGAILSEYRVVTACHCLIGYDRITFEIIAGTTDFTEFTVGTQFKRTDRFVLHPQCRLTVNDFWFYDLALVLLDKDPFIFNTVVHPIDWVDPEQFDKYHEEVVKKKVWCEVAGWGRTGMEGESSLRVAQKKLIPDYQCECILEMVVEGYPEGNNDMKRLTINGNICAEDIEAFTHEGKGDSGSPLVCGGKVVGVVSVIQPVTLIPPTYIVTYGSMQYGVDWTYYIDNEVTMKTPGFFMRGQKKAGGNTGQIPPSRICVYFLTLAHLMHSTST